jgi:8-oxo-dGTP diphosphatase
MNTIIVAAGILIESGRVLLTQRKPGSHMPNLWEFPGGKAEAGEDPKDAVIRELREELGITVIVGDIVCATFYRYREKAVLLLFYDVTRTAASKQPEVLDVAAFRWATRQELDPAVFPPADVEVLAKVRARL